MIEIKPAYMHSNLKIGFLVEIFIVFFSLIQEIFSWQSCRFFFLVPCLHSSLLQRGAFDKWQITLCFIFVKVGFSFNLFPRVNTATVTVCPFEFIILSCPISPPPLYLSFFLIHSPLCDPCWQGSRRVGGSSRQELMCDKWGNFFYVENITYMEYGWNIQLMLTGNQCKWGKSSKTMQCQRITMKNIKFPNSKLFSPWSGIHVAVAKQLPQMKSSWNHYQLLRTCMHLETRRPDGCWCRRRRRGQGRTWRPRRSPSREWRLLPRGHQEGGGGEVCANRGNIWSGRGKRSNGIKEFEKEFLNKQEWHQLGEHVGGVGGGGGGHHVRQDPADQQVRQQDFWSGDHPPLFPRMHDVRCGGALVLLCTQSPPRVY